MKLKISLLSLCLLSGLTSAFAYPLMPKSASEYVQDKSFAFEAEYDSRYDYQGIPVSSKMNHDGVFVFKGEMEMPLASSGWSQLLTAEYLAFCDGWLENTNGFNASWSAKKEIFPNLYFEGGYGLLYGGLPGSLSKWRGKAPHSLAQVFNAGLKYEDSGRGLFANFDTQYGFYGLTGWRFGLEAGKRFAGVALNGRMDAVASVMTYYSLSYWCGGVTGFDSFGFRFALPIRITGHDEKKGLQLEPFIQTIWAGNNASRVNRRMEAPIMDEFDLSVGVKLRYSF